MLAGAVVWTAAVQAQSPSPGYPRINLDEFDPSPTSVPAPAAAPTPDASPAAVLPSRAYVLNPDDLILVEVYQEPDLTARRRIAADGTISLNYFENAPVPVGSKTLEEAQTLIQTLYEKDVLVNPRVTITMLEAAKWKFIVMGEVARPATYEVSGGTKVSIVHALAMAGGATSKGNIKNVVVTRFVNNAKQVLRLDINRMMRDADSVPFVVQAGDIISVGEKVF